MRTRTVFMILILAILVAACGGPEADGAADATDADETGQADDGDDGDAAAELSGTVSFQTWSLRANFEDYVQA
jgi:ABC-type glycerol-3-phosphate transport system substrate-binding protein